MSFLTELLSQFGENYGKNTTEDYIQKDQNAEEQRLAKLAQLQRQVEYKKSAPYQEFWGQTEQGRASLQEDEANLARLIQMREQGYPTSLGQDIQQAVGNTLSDTASGRPFTRLTKTEGQSKAWDKFQDLGGNAVMGLGTALAPTPKFLSGPKSIPKSMSFAPEEAGLIAKASGAKPIYGAAQKASAKAGATASPAQLKSMTDLQYSVGGDVGSALSTERAVPMRGSTLNQAGSNPKVSASNQTFNVTSADGTVIGTDGKVIKELGEQGGIKYKQVEYTNPTTGKRTTSSVPEPNLRSAQATGKVEQAPVAKATEVEKPKTKWQQVKKGVGTAAKVSGIATPAYLIGRNWNQKAGLPEQAAPAPAQPPFDPTFSSLNVSQGPSAADQFMQQDTSASAQKEPTFIEKLLEQVLTQNKAPAGMTEEQLLQRMNEIVNQNQTPPPQVPDNKPKSTLGMIMDALGRGLIAGGTGQADPDEAQKLEMERMVTNQNLAQNARKLTPQQEMTMQMLQSLLVNKLNQGNSAQQGAQGQNNALIQALVSSYFSRQQTGATQQFTAGQNELDRASAEKIAGVRSAAAAQKAARDQKLLDTVRASLPGYVPPEQPGPQVNFGR